MAQPFIGDIRMVGFNFAPVGYAMCNGQLLSIAQNAALFSLLGTTYGGDGQTTFALPNFQGRLPFHQGNGLTLGQSGGSEEVTLTGSQIPTHPHPLMATNGTGTSNSPFGNVLAKTATAVYSQPGNPTSMADVITLAGNSQPHTNIQPYLTVTFIIALEGAYPSQS
jgi:microcystin-dependent protein